MLVRLRVVSSYGTGSECDVAAVVLRRRADRYSFPEFTIAIGDINIISVEFNTGSLEEHARGRMTSAGQYYNVQTQRASICLEFMRMQPM